MFPNEIPLVVFSAGAGSQGMDTRNRIHMLARAFAERDIRPAILTTRYANHISPGADKGVQLIEAIDAAAEQYNTSRRFFLTGFSRGGQFTQRFVFHAAPERVFAAVPCNPGSWTMPQGGNLHRSDNEHGMDTHPLGTPMPDDAEGWSEAQWDASLQPALQ